MSHLEGYHAAKSALEWQYEIGIDEAISNVPINRYEIHTTPPKLKINSESNIAHEATTSKISEEQLHYCQQRGLSQEEAVGLIVNGFCKEVLQQLPMEFAVEAQKLVGISLEGSVG